MKLINSGLPFRPIAQLQEVGVELSKLTEPNPTTNALKKQEPYKMVFILTARKTLSFRSQDASA
ncbi:hypothetical protein TH0006_02880 [Helicobacter pylori]